MNGHSEGKFQCELNGPGATKLIERVESALANTASRKALPQHLRRLSEWTTETGQVTDRRPEVRMVQNIEQLSAELQPDGFMNRKISMDSKIPLSRSESSQ